MTPHPQSLTHRVQAAVQHLVRPTDAALLAGRLGYAVDDVMRRYSGQVPWSIDDLDRLAAATGQPVERFLQGVPMVAPDRTRNAYPVEHEWMMIVAEVIEDLRYATEKVSQLLEPGSAGEAHPPR